MTHSVATARGTFRSPVTWTMVFLVVYGTALLVRENAEAARAAGATTAVAVVVWSAYTTALVPLVLRSQRYGRRPIGLVLLVLAWGGLAAGGIAQRANIALGTILAEASLADATSWTTTPLVEESLKLLGVVGVALIPAAVFRSALDGVVYGMLSGAGFLIVENVAYTVASLVDGDAASQVMLRMVLLRGIVGGVLTHAVFTALNGAAVGYFVANRGRPLVPRGSVVVGTLLLTIVAHSFYNRGDVLGPVVLLIASVPLVALVFVVRHARRQERHRLIALARGGAGGPSADELQRIVSDDRTARDILRSVWLRDRARAGVLDPPSPSIPDTGAPP